MRVVRHLGVACLLLCAVLVPSRADASVIHTFVDSSSASTTFAGTFEYDNDLALLYFTLSGPSFISAEVTTGFEPLLTLFVDFPTAADPTPEFDMAYWFYLNRESAVLEETLLDAGNYVLALTQYDKYFTQGFGFDYSTDAGQFFTGLAPFCGAGDAGFDTCRSGAFSATLTVEPLLQPVPEPGTLSLLVLGGAAAAWRRRGRSSHHRPPRRG